ncbi:MAG: hypothetical protein M0R22_04270 [Dehalococcoidia bacterium]|jgi:tyrosyl-tRNA synthetase|nr:hypothetical protein [Dehalococcoidia bacterium]
MGRSEKDALEESQHIYPCMQVADVFELVPGGVDICQLGLDQRKANMLARDYASKIGAKPPIVLSHHMLLGLKYRGKSATVPRPAATAEPEEKLVAGAKMSKSDPDSAIFMDDSTTEIHRKIAGAYCADSPVDNPVFEYIKYIVLRWYGYITIGGIVYHDADSVATVWPILDKRAVKEIVAGLIDGIVDRVRCHFAASPDLTALLERVATYRTTR